MKNVFLLALLIIPLLVQAQKIKDRGVAINWVKIPSEKLPDSYQTYTVDVRGPGVYDANESPEVFNAMFQFDGFKKLDALKREAGHLRALFDVSDVHIGKPEKKMEERTTKKDGKEIKTKHYHYEVLYSMHVNFRIIDPNGGTLIHRKYPYSDNKSFKESKNSSEAYNDYKNKKNNLKIDYALESIEEAIRRANEDSSEKFDFDIIQKNVLFNSIKKDPSEKDWEHFLGVARAAFGDMDASDDPKATLERLQEPIAFWEEMAESGSVSDKKFKKIYRAAHSNIARAFFYLDEFDKAEKHALLVIESEGKDGRMKRLLSSIRETKELFKLHGINTLHYKVDLSGAKSPDEIAEVIEEQMDQMEEKDNVSGSIIMKGENISGAFLLDPKAKDLILGEGGNLVFVRDEGGKVIEYLLDSDEITHFTMGNRSFEKVTFAPASKGGKSEYGYYREKLYDSEKITLFKYYPVGNPSLNDLGIEYVFMKTSDGFEVSFDSGSFLIFKKGVAKHFGSCPEINEMNDEGEFNSDEDNLIKLIRIYSEICE